MNKGVILIGIGAVAITAYFLYERNKKNGISAKAPNNTLTEQPKIVTNTSTSTVGTSVVNNNTVATQPALTVPKIDAMISTTPKTGGVAIRNNVPTAL